MPAPIIVKIEESQDSATESSSSSSSSAITLTDKKEKSKQEPSTSTKTTIKTSKLIPESNKILIKTETEPKTPEKSSVESHEVKTTTSSKENKYTNLVTNSNMKLLSSPKSAHPRLWLPKTQASTDQVFITDVTVNLETVTIRECKTERGFFKSRHDEENERNSQFAKAQ